MAITAQTQGRIGGPRILSLPHRGHARTACRAFVVHGASTAARS